MCSLHTYLQGAAMGELNSTEAVYGFAAWLSTRKERIVFGGTADTKPVVDAVATFCSLNNLPEVSEDWPKNLNMPEES